MHHNSITLTAKSIDKVFLNTCQSSPVNLTSSQFSTDQITCLVSKLQPGTYNLISGYKVIAQLEVLSLGYVLSPINKIGERLSFMVKRDLSQAIHNLMLGKNS